jgi:2-polyprenyl-6-methoxyphenol hydroxylase-like FAD-dependent oxidoreductase
MIDVEVLVVGAGPVGLALSGDLCWRGHSSLCIDRGDGSISQPKMDLVGIRTMEFCRKWGIVGDVEATAYDRNYPQDNVYLTNLRGYELGRHIMPSMNDEKPPPESPQKRERCPQNFFDPVLKKFATSFENHRMLYETEFLSFEQTDQIVISQIKCLKTGKVSELRSRFLVGCDGGKSKIRESLGFEMKGRGLLTYTTNVIFRCANFNALHDKAPGYRYMLVGPTGTWATVVAINGKDQWRMSIIGNASEKKTYTENELKEFAYQALGAPFELEILSVLPWQRAELVAQGYSSHRVFICGDACHLTSPTGGLGMNTGIGDAVDLSWKISAVLKGYGADQLLNSYFIERQPIAKRITQFSTSNLDVMKHVPSSPLINEDSDAGRMVREKVGHAMREGLKKEWFSMNMHLGNRYVNSPICIYDEVEDPILQEHEFNDAIHYKPSSRVGVRAPHVWLDEKTSTLDLFGRNFVLLCFTDLCPSLTHFIQQAQSFTIPLNIERIHSKDAKILYEKAYVLVRPDGHVAWRGDTGPEDAKHTWLTLTGHSKC